MEHFPADRAVQLGHPVGPLRQAQPHVRHVEHAWVVVLGAQRQDAVQRHAGQQAAVLEAAPDQVHREAVDAGRDRGVRREHRARAHRRQRLVEVQAGAADQFADPFQAQEAGVALVGVEDRSGRGPAGQVAVPADRAHAADAGQDLLADAVFLVAAVEAVGDAAQLRVVARRCPSRAAAAGCGRPSPPTPSRAVSRLPGSATVITTGRPSVSVSCSNGSAARVVGRVVLQLPAVPGQRLAEVAVAVVQADADQRECPGRTLP